MRETRASIPLPPPLVSVITGDSGGGLAGPPGGDNDDDDGSGGPRRPGGCADLASADGRGKLVGLSAPAGGSAWRPAFEGPARASFGQFALTMPQSSTEMERVAVHF